MADALTAPRLQATYGRSKAFLPPSSDDEDQITAPSSSSPRLKLFDSSPPIATHRSRLAMGDEGDTGDTTPNSSEEHSAPISTSTGVNKGGLTPAMRLAKAMGDTDSDLSEEESIAGGSQGADAVARLRAKMAGPSASRTGLDRCKQSHAASLGSSDQYTSSLSSAPPLSSDDHRKHHAVSLDHSSGSEADSEAFASALMRAGRRGATAGRMKKREPQKSSASSLEAPRPSSPTLTRRPTPAILHFSSDEAPSQSPSSSAADLLAARVQSEAAMLRQKRLAEMAARKRVASPSLEEQFFNEKAKQAQRGDNVGDGHISSESNGIESDSSDLPSARELLSKAATSSKQARSEDKGSGQTKKNNRRTSSKVEKTPKGPKQLSKRELEEMHKTTAKIERNRHRDAPLLSRPVQRQQFDLSTLAAMFNPANTAKPGDEAPLDVDMDVDHDPIVTETPRASRSASGGQRAKEDLDSSSKSLHSGSLDVFPPRPKARDAPSSDSIELEDNFAPVHSEEQLQQAARDLTLRRKKERWLEAQKKLQPPKLTTSTRGPTKEDLVESLQIMGMPPARVRPKPVVGLAATSLMNSAIQEKIRKQNILARAAREAASRQQGLAQQLKQQGASSTTQGADAVDDSMTALQRIQERVGRQSGRDRGHDGDDDAPDDEDENDEDDDADFVLEEDDEAVATDNGENHFSRGSASEYDEEEEIMPRSSQQPPPSSQNTNRSYGSSGRRAADLKGIHNDNYDDDDDDDDDDDVDVTLTANRPARARRAVLDDEDVESSEGRQQKSESTDEIQSSRERADNGGRQQQDRPLGLTQFLGGFAASPIEMSPTQPVFGEENRTRGLSATHAGASKNLQVPAATGDLGRVPSDDSVLGQFFQETQLSEVARGFSLDVIGATGRARNAEVAPFLQASLGSADNGFSQFFNEGTQLPSAGAPKSSSGLSLLMGPPTTLPTDGFAALRRAAHDEAELIDSGSPLPSNDGFEDDEEVEHAAAGPAHAGPSIRTPQKTTPKQYLNREGFFTQTKPVFAGLDASQSQTQLSQMESSEKDRTDIRRESSADQTESDADADADGSPRATRRKRFRRALQPAEEQEQERGQEELLRGEKRDASESNVAGSGSEAEGDEEEEVDARVDATGSDSDDDQQEEEEDTTAGALHPGATRNAWDILRQGQARAEVLAAAGFKQQHGKKRQRDYQFIEGEAEESDEDDDGRRNTKGAGGLDGVFSDSSSDGEGEEEDDDGHDLEELVDNERELDEAEKDVLARERYQKDLDADDEAAMVLADKAARGELRNKRRLRDGDRLEDLLDDDFDEERLMRRANNPRAMIAKRRKIEGDEMESLAAKEESQAFVRGYSETHRADVADEYDFLAQADTDEDAGEGGRAAEHGEEDSAASSGGSTDDDTDGDNGDNDVMAGQRVRFAQEEQDDEEEALQGVQRVTRRQLARELRERRMRRKQGIVSSDEEGEEPTKQPRDPFDSASSSDEDDFTASRPGYIHDRLAVVSAKASGSPRRQQRPATVASAKAKTVVPSMFQRRPTEATGVTPPEGQADDDHDDDDDDDDDDNGGSIDPSVAIQARLLRRQASRCKNSTPRTAIRLAKLTEDLTSEPDFAAGRSRFAGGAGGGAGATGAGNGARVTSWGQQAGPSGGKRSDLHLQSYSSSSSRGFSGDDLTNRGVATKAAAEGQRRKGGHGHVSVDNGHKTLLGGAILAERRVEESQ